MCWFQILYEKLSTAFLSEVMNILKFKIAKLRPRTHKENDSKNSMTEKASQFIKRVSEFFQKTLYEKIRFHLQKYEKYLYSKNDIKKLLEFFNNNL